MYCHSRHACRPGKHLWQFFFWVSKIASDRYEQHRDRVAADQREQSKAGRDIGKIPKVKDRARKEACRTDLLRYLPTYYPETFALRWSPDHQRFIADVQNVVLHGGRKAIAMPRGSGKTSVLVRAGNWALSYGHRSFLALIAAEEQAAEELADQLRVEWETNDLLLEDFPEIAFPIREMEGVNQRAKAQTCGGRRTHIRWKGKTLVFPTVTGSPASGAIVRVAGLLGRIRGMSVTSPATGKTDRPDIFLLDDFQSDESARSETQCATREKTANGAILGLAGPGKTMAGLASCTVIRMGDAADRILNHTLYPRWNGSRCKLIYKWPPGKLAEELWERYLEIRAAELAAGDEYHPKANAYYKAHRKAMDAGARVGWPDRKLPHELSALQHAYGLRHDNVDTFDAEYQNEPKAEQDADTDFVGPTSDQLVVKLGPYKRRQVPTDGAFLGAAIDVQKYSLWWVTASVAEDFSGWVVDRGVWPPQRGLGEYFTNEQVNWSYQDETGMSQPDAALQEALERLTTELFGQRYERDSGESLRLDRCMIDAGYLGKTVYDFCRGSSLAVMPALGVGVGAKQVAWEHTRKQRGERRGPGWKMPPVRRTDAPRHVSIDTNEWGTRLQTGLGQPVSGTASWHLYRASPQHHRMLADNLTAEFSVKTEGRGRKLYEWECRVGRDNHWHDCLRMIGVAASMAGIKVPGETDRKSARKKTSAQKGPKKSLAQRRAEALAKRAVG